MANPTTTMATITMVLAVIVMVVVVHYHNIENHHNLNISKFTAYITTLLQVPNYKTTLCQPWTSSGQCSYGDTCMYAHGRAQLRVQQGAVGTVQYQYQYRDSNKDSNIIHRGTQQHSAGAVQPDSKRFRV